MAPGEPFVDYYDVLGVEPGCDAKALEAAYHELLKVYHPDHSGSADTVTFNRLIQAYRVLRNPEQRAEYDRLHAQVNGRLAEGMFNRLPHPRDRRISHVRLSENARTQVARYLLSLSTGEAYEESPLRLRAAH